MFFPQLHSSFWLNVGREVATPWRPHQPRTSYKLGVGPIKRSFFLQTITSHMALHVYNRWYNSCWVFHTSHIRREATSCEPIFFRKRKNYWKTDFIKEIDFRQGRQTFGNTKLTNRHFFGKKKMPILNTLYLRLTYKTNRSWSCYIFWSDQSPANQWSVRNSLSEPVIDKVTNWAVLER